MSDRTPRHTRTTPYFFAIDGCIRQWVSRIIAFSPKLRYTAPSGPSRGVSTLTIAIRGGSGYDSEHLRLGPCLVRWCVT
jgi:hypothetical protein